ncbi:MAG: DarT ssDNA thymidine ADP-ribosyltransferase family protein [Solirubrobacteraceae bacterium]
MPPIYHFTDVENLPGILAAGELRCHRIAPSAVDVGDISIKARRTLIHVRCGPGGKVCDYVPFYYGAARLEGRYASRGITLLTYRWSWLRRRSWARW